jgi:protein AroM
MKKIGMLTIGQSPRNDIIPSLKQILGEENEIIEVGAMDDHNLDDVMNIDLNPEDYILVTRMRNGREVKITKKYILPFMQESLNKIESKGARVTVIMCTGKFPQFKSKGIVVTPSEILKGVIEGTLKKGRLGIVYPTPEQKDYAVRDFGKKGIEIFPDSVSPYEPKDVRGLLDRLKKWDLDLIFLNCFGFPTELKEKVIDFTCKPTIQSNTLVARVLKELITR